MKITRRLAPVLFALGLCAGTAFAQGSSVKIETSREKNFGASPVIIVPTVYLRLAASGHIFVAKQGSALSTIGGGNANTVRASARYTVKGLDKKLAQELAAKVHDDFVGRLRAAGFTVKTYADIRDLPTVTKATRLEKDAATGLTLEKDASGQTVFIVATPGDEQAFKPSLGGAVFKPFMSLGKSTLGEGTVLIPTYTIVAPQVWGEKGGGYATISAGINVAPGMNLESAFLPLLTQKGAWGDARTKGIVVNVSAKVGEIGKQDTTDKTGNAFSSALSTLTGAGGISTKSASYTFTIDQTAYSEGVLKGTGDFNEEVIKIVANARK